MSAYAHRSHDRKLIRILLQWRWLVLVIAIPFSLVIEIIEGNSSDLNFLDEVIIDGLVLPLSTWLVLTFAARNLAQQFEREEILEQRQSFLQRLAEHWEYNDLAGFLVRFPSTVLPLDRAALFVADQRHGRVAFVTEWRAADSSAPRVPLPLPQPAVCRTCLSASATHVCRADDCPLEPGHKAGGLEYCVPLAHGDELVGVLRLRCQPGRTPTAEQLDFITALSSEMALAIANSRRVDRGYREAQIQERRRITHEMHDTLAQQVFYLHLGLDQLAGDPALPPGSPLQPRIESMRDVAADVYEQVRNNLSILRAWERADLSEAVGRLARVTAHSADLSVAIDVHGEPRWLSPHTCEDIYGVVREILNNVVKHARARHVQLDLLWSAEHLVISVADDGVGFDAAQHPGEGHFGLALMREALDALQGTLVIDSRTGGGTRVQAAIPLPPHEQLPAGAGAWPHEQLAPLDMVL